MLKPFKMIGMIDEVRMSIALERSLRDFFTAAAKHTSTHLCRINLRTWVLTTLCEKAKEDLGISYEEYLDREKDNDKRKSHKTRTKK